jgi:hypothetical protein
MDTDLKLMAIMFVAGFVMFVAGFATGCVAMVQLGF